MAEQKLSSLRRTVVGAQFMFVAFGSTVLVPLLVGFDPAVALLAAGLGTLLFHLITKGKVPVYLGSSFAFIAPIIKATELYGLSGMFCGLRSSSARSSCSSVFPLRGQVSIWPRRTGSLP